MAILIILILPIQEHGISFHFCESSSVSFISVLEFSAYRSFTSLVRFIPVFVCVCVCVGVCVCGWVGVFSAILNFFFLLSDISLLL